jgi:hypothetical protein
MQTVLASTFLFSLALFMSATSPIAQATEGEACGEFVVYGEYGIDVGDSRSGFVRLFDENGREIGEKYFYSVVSQGSEDGTFRLIGHGHYLLPGGTIAISANYRMLDPTVDGAPIEAVENIVIGGSGTYFGARGLITWVADEQSDLRRGEVDIDCVESE